MHVAATDHLMWSVVMYLCCVQDSLEEKEGVAVDATVEGAVPLTRFQFERLGYFCVDYDSRPDRVRDV